ncbi:MAG: putative metal-binding motif-containing protein [Alphaproteobacteria bacterium]|nr:putative metal-binding motif-containing protein [Alphaproteobacteria bacterium]MCB9792603.1 putative metal-binding motif-containing protein [Alphaproteobacteria bacterium]
MLLFSCDGYLFDPEKHDPGMWIDEDGDGYPMSMDCSDIDTAIFPDAAESCDGLDNDCDGIVDEGVGGIWYFDSDLDGFGDPNSMEESCENPGNYVDKAGDCDDNDPNTYPGALEYCDGADNDCNDLVDDEAVDGSWYSDDLDGDGFGARDSFYWACEGVTNNWDCNDLNTSEPHVASPSGSATPDGSVANPWASIQDAITYAQECVVALPGTYREAINFQGKGLLVVGAGGPESTIIDATGFSAPAVTFANGEGADAELVGFTLTGGTGYVDSSSSTTNCYSNYDCVTTYNTHCGGGVYANYASPTLTDINVTGNSLPAVSTVTSGYDTTYTYSFGGGVCLLGSQSTLDGVDIIGNYADQAGGLYVGDGASVTFKRAALMDNSATDGGAIQVDAAELDLNNAVLAFNSASTDGGALHVLTGTALVTNATIDHNGATNGGGALVGSGGSLELLNSLLTNNSSGNGLTGETGAAVSVQYSGSYLNTPATYSNLSSDPNADASNTEIFIDYMSVVDDGDVLNDDHHLTSTSPVIDLGHPAAEFNDVDGTRNDMGAYGGPDGEW